MCKWVVVSYFCHVDSQGMEGFGYDEQQSTPFHYGSVRDGMVDNPSLEHKLKKQYWKTKQTVLQKLKKTEDEFVVAGDADIDAKLEVSKSYSGLCSTVCVCG